MSRLHQERQDNQSVELKNSYPDQIHLLKEQLATKNQIIKELDEKEKSDLEDYDELMIAQRKIIEKYEVQQGQISVLEVELNEMSDIVNDYKKGVEMYKNENKIFIKKNKELEQENIRLKKNRKREFDVPDSEIKKTSRFFQRM